MAILHSNLDDQIGSIQIRKDLVAFIHQLVQNLKTAPSEWENHTLESYLEALAAWVEDCDEYYANRNEEVPEDPSWKFLGEALLAARIYE